MNKNTLAALLSVLALILIGAYLLMPDSQVDTVSVDTDDVKVDNKPMPVVGNNDVKEMIVTSDELTLSAIANHNNKQDCWLVVEGGVYNVTGFEDKHPGGAEAILNNCGKDATEMFNSIKDGEGHPVNARNMLKNFLVGELVDDGVSLEGSEVEQNLDTENNADL